MQWNDGPPDSQTSAIESEGTDRWRNLRGNAQPSPDILSANTFFATAFVPDVPDDNSENFRGAADWAFEF
jgi:hypothetical protein